MALENAVAKYTVSIVQDGSTAPAVQEFNNLRVAAQDASVGTTTATNSLRELRETSMLTRESTRVLSESAILLGGNMGEVAKGALLASEGMRGLRTAAMLFGVSIESLVPVIGAIAVAVGAGVLIWKEWESGQTDAIKTQNELNESLRQMPELLKHVNDAIASGALSSGQGSALLQLIGAQKPGAQDFSKLNAAPSQNFSTNAQLSAGFHISTSQAGIPDSADIRAANDELVKTGELLKIIDEQGKTTYVENPALQAVKAQKEMVDKLNVDVLDGFAKQRAEAEKTYDQQIEKLKQIQQLENFIQDPAQRSSALAANSSAQGLAGQARDNSVSAINDKEDLAVQTAYNQMLQEQDALDKQIETDELRIATQKQAALDKATQQETQLAALEGRITESNLTGEARKKQAIEDTTNALVAQFTKVATELGLSQQEIDAWVAKIKSGGKVATDSISTFSGEIQKNIMSIQQIGVSAATDFASGFANAFMEFADGTKTAAQAFEQFAAQFLEHIAEMILQQLVLQAIMSAAGFLGGGGVVTAAGSSASGFGSVGSLAAAGGIFPRMMAGGGFAGMVNSATYFPRFNVVGGEAGGEMMAALARPTFRSIGGIDAVVGNAGNNRLAITNADDLASMGGSGMGGHIVIEIRGTPDFEARIVSNSVKRAQVQITRDLTHNTPISKGVKNLTA